MGISTPIMTSSDNNNNTEHTVQLNESEKGGKDHAPRDAKTFDFLVSNAITGFPEPCRAAQRPPLPDLHRPLCVIWGAAPRMASSTAELVIAEMKIPDEIFSGIPPSQDKVPQCPVLVFINSRSGGQLGSELLRSYREVLSPLQIFDLGKDKPEEVLHHFLNKLENLKRNNCKVAEEIREKLKIIVAGGDGTAGWLLEVVGDLKLSQPPPIATVPLGTGNNLPYSFGWGKKNPGTDVGSVKRFLVQVYNAKPMNIDSWHVELILKTEDDKVEPVKLPHSLHRFIGEKKEPGLQTFRGGFWNYFSMGMDAQVSYEFHRKREEHPELFKNQLMNQGMYAKIGVTQGWFSAKGIHPKSRSINHLADIFIKGKHDRDWKKLGFSDRIRSIVMLNLPSFSGGLNPWGSPRNSKRTKSLTPAYVNDGLIELVGFRDGWHGLVLLAPHGHGTRLAQAHKVKICFKSDAGDEIYMRMDGEPWLQPLPKVATVIKITPLRQAVMLKTDNCISRCVPHDAGTVESISDPSTSSHLHIPDSATVVQGLDSESDGSDTEINDLTKKFGAADTFRIIGD